MNSFLTHLVRGDHSLQLAAHLAAGILTLVLLTGFARSNPAPSSSAAAETQAATSHVVASAMSR